MIGGSLHTVSVERNQLTTDTIDLLSTPPNITQRILLKSSDLFVPRYKTTNYTVCFDKKSIHYFNNATKALKSISVLSASSNREISDCYLSPDGLLLWVQFKLTELQSLHFYSMVYSIPYQEPLCDVLTKGKDQYNNTIKISNDSKHIFLIENGNFNIYKIPENLFTENKPKTKHLVEDYMFKINRIINIQSNVYISRNLKKNFCVKNGSIFKLEVINSSDSKECVVVIYEDCNYKCDLDLYKKERQYKTNTNINNNYTTNAINNNSSNNGTSSGNNVEEIADRRNKAFDEYKDKVGYSFEPKRQRMNSNDNINTNNSNNNIVKGVKGGIIYYYKFKPSNSTLSLIHSSKNALVCRSNSDYFKHSIFTISSSLNSPITFILFTQTSKTLSKSLKYYDSTVAELYLLSNNELNQCLEISEFISLTAIKKSFVIVYGILPNTRTNVYNLTKSQRFKKETLNVTEVSDCYLSNCNKVACFLGAGNLGGKLKFFEYNKEKKELGEGKHIGTRKLEWSKYNSNYLLTAALYPFRRVDNGINIWKYNGEKVVFIEKKNLLDCSFIGPVEIEKTGKIEVQQKSNKKMSMVPGLDELNKFLK